MGFREKLKEELSYKGMLVKELSALSGVNKRSIDTYLREKGSVPSADAAVRIARVLGVSVEYLITGAESSCKAQTILSAESRLLINTIEKLCTADRKFIIHNVGSMIDSLKVRDKELS